ncbi:MAG: hypothetical protein JZD40_01820 [Sulfolobus sp.]|nr:hypothetical protein [Sulfolobus sp.]
MIKIYKGDSVYKVTINDPFLPVDFEFKGEDINISLSQLGLSVSIYDDKVVVEKPLDLKEHVVDLGEKAFELDRKRKRYVIYNIDAGAYKRFQDPLYINIPFFISTKEGETRGYFFNSASKLIFDIGLEEYYKVKVLVPEDSLA